MKFVPTLTFLF